MVVVESMRLYSGTSEQFIQDTAQNQIAEKLENAFINYYRHKPSPNEKNSWMNSLRAVSLLFQSVDLLDHGVLLEYQLPLTSLRLDCMICGKDRNMNDNSIIIELKQWTKCEESDGDNEVLTWVAGRKRDLLHPSVQVGQYKMHLQDMHTAFYDGASPIILNACTYLHNYKYDKNDVIFAPKFEAALRRCPLFTADDTIQLGDYLLDKLEKGRGLDVLKRVEESKFRTSKKLMDHIGNTIKGKTEYILLDEQLVAYDQVFSQAKKGFHDGNKIAIIIKGGPGTGKSVIAINLMADLLLKGYNSYYATGSKAFTETLRAMIGRRGSTQFKYFSSFTKADPNSIDVLICDEAHRIWDTSNNRWTRKEDKSNLKLVEEILRASKVSVFFIDDLQVVRPDEIGSVSYIKEFAEKHNCKIFEHELDIQFRCSGSDAFVNWVDNTFGIQRTANILWTKEESFDFRIFESPEELESAITSKVEEGYTGRMTAGFCWKWSKPNSGGYLENDVVIGEFKRPWNAKPDAGHLAAGIPKSHYWATEPNGINQIGCVYTAQGFEFDYVGIILGKDLVYDFDQQAWIGNKEHSHDSRVKSSKDDFTKLIKNTYRILLTRGLKGCYVYFMDKDTERFVKSRMEV
jgi:hypothetical protein